MGPTREHSPHTLDDEKGSSLTVDTAEPDFHTLTARATSEIHRQTIPADERSPPPASTTSTRFASAHLAPLAETPRSPQSPPSDRIRTPPGSGYQSRWSLRHYLAGWRLPSALYIREGHATDRTRHARVRRVRGGARKHAAYLSEDVAEGVAKNSSVVLANAVRKEHGRQTRPTQKLLQTAIWLVVNLQTNVHALT